MSKSSPARMHVERQEIDRILRDKREQREAKACYPCRQRKVKCDNNHPCKTCQKRGHPQICVYDVDRPSPRKQTRRSSRLSNSYNAPVSDLIESTGTVQDNQPDARDFLSSNENVPTSVSRESVANYAFSGDNTVISILGSRGIDGSIAHEASSVLGLHNTYSSYPFFEPNVPGDRPRALVEVLPRKEEVLKFFHFYRITAHPFNPILVDIDSFEVEICNYLNSYASGEFRDPNKISDQWLSDRYVGLISLLLATLAAGAHFSDLESQQRAEAAQNLARRSFQTLRLANFLFRPSLEVVQALLILGNTLQNSGQADAAWALLGTTVRLAQTLGLHTGKGISRWPERLRIKARTLWSMTVWQDSLLSLCFDRPSIVSTKDWQLDFMSATEPILSYRDVMYYLCWHLLNLNAEELEQNNLDRSIQALAALDNVLGKVQPYLSSRDRCTSLQQFLENLALRIHVSFYVSVLCRPAIKSPPTEPDDPRIFLLCDRAKESLINATKAFLDFQNLSTVPMRTWSMVHTVLSSTLLLCLWQETRNDSECLDLQQRVIEAFSRVDTTGKDADRNSSNGQWLSPRHIRALVALRNAVHNTPLGETDQGQQVPPQNYRTQPSSDRTFNPEEMNFAELQPYGAFPPNFDLDLPENWLGNNTDLSPVSYLDSIINVPIFNFPEFN